MKEARLILDDGTEFCGQSFGYEANAVGEVVFSTAMTGYPESLKPDRPKLCRADTGDDLSLDRKLWRS